MPSPSDPWFAPLMALVVCAVVALGLWAILRIIRDAGRAGVAVVNASGDAATRVAEGLARVMRDTFNLQPRVTVAGETRIEGPQRSRELVMVKQSLERSHRWSNQKLWSTKSIVVSARFTVSVGFDLTQPIDVDIGRDGRTARVTLPQPKVLAVQIDALNPATEEEGWWNRVTAEDRVLVQQEMQRLVEKDAREGDLLNRAEAEFRQVVAAEMARQGGRVDFQFMPMLCDRGDEGPAPTGTSRAT